VETLFLSLFNIQSFIDSGEIREAENPLDKAKEISFEIGFEPEFEIDLSKFQKIIFVKGGKDK